MHNNEIIGSVGISGDKGENDEKICIEAVKKWFWNKIMIELAIIGLGKWGLELVKSVNEKAK